MDIQDKDHVIRWVNTSAVEAYGFPMGDLIGRKCHEIRHGRDEPCVGCPVSKVWNTGVPEEGEIITDDNQLLAYGWDRFARTRSAGRNWYHAMYRTNLRILEVFRSRLARAQSRVPAAR